MAFRRVPVACTKSTSTGSAADVRTAELIVDLVQGYGLIGLVVAAAFLLFGIERIDASARGAYAFRPLLVPGIVLLWPLVLVLWLRRAPARA